MGRLYKANRPIVDIHEAYGIKLRGEIDEYESVIDQCTREIIVRLWVNDIEIELDARGIYRNKENGLINMEDDKDLLCYWIANTDHTPWELHQFFTKEYTGCLWRSRARDMQMRERQRKEREIETKEREAKRNKELEECRVYADKKKLYMIVDGETVYFIKLTGKNKEIVDSGNANDKMILDFAHDYPGNGCDIVETREVA